MINWYENYKKRFDEAMKKSDALGDGLVVGKLFEIQVDDGYSWYEIVKINKNTVRIKWRSDITLDGYQDWYLGIGGSFSKNKIENVINHRDAINRIFAKK